MDDDALRAWSVSVRYPGQPEPALADVSLSIGPQALTVALGPSGCGKTTLLNVLAGFVPPSQGRVTLAGAPITGPGADRAVVFQHDALLPWLDVRDNVAFALELQGVGRRERHARAEALLAEVGLAHAARQPVWTLSGGMRQRVGIARALASPSRALLMDEPFGALDAFTREELWCMLRDLWQEKPFTVILVTHDLREAVFLADTVYVMSARPGRVLLRHPIDLPRPRDLDLTYTDAFAQHVHALREHIGQPRH